MHHISARPEQLQSVPSVVTAALRAAALAPSDRDAIDVLGLALVRLVVLTKQEVSHA